MRSARKPPAARLPHGPLEVVIVCRAELLLLGLERLLSSEQGIRVFTYSRVPDDAATDQPRRRTAGEPTRVALLCDRLAPDPAGDCERLLESLVDAVVVLCGRAAVNTLTECMAAGARAFVMEGDPAGTVVEAVRAAARGRTYVGQRSLDLLVEWLAQQQRSEHGSAGRERDRDLLRLLAEGRSTADIAAHFGIAPKTVRNRLSRLYRHLGVHSRAAAIRLAEQQGLIDLRSRRR